MVGHRQPVPAKRTTEFAVTDACFDRDGSSAHLDDVVEMLGGDQRFSIDRARRELGYVPQVDVKHGVAAGVQWYLDQKKG